jgi:hypothetical protein
MFPVAYTLDIKHIFLGFLQAFFRDGPDIRFKWTANQETTHILIVDKFSADKLSNERRPIIALSRNRIAPMMSTIKQRLSRNMAHNVERYQDLLQGTVTLNCLSQSNIMAEELAHTVMMAVLSYRDDLRANNGIHQIMDISIGEEILVVSDSKNVYVNVPVNISFTKHMRFTPVPRLSTGYYITLTSGGGSTQWFEGIHYNVIRNQIQTYNPIPSGITATFSYMRYDTSGIYSQSLSGINGIQTIFPTDHQVLAYYPILWGVSGLYAASGLTYGYTAGPTDITYSGWFGYSGGQNLISGLREYV